MREKSKEVFKPGSAAAARSIQQTGFAWPKRAELWTVLRGKISFVVIPRSSGVSRFPPRNVTRNATICDSCVADRKNMRFSILWVAALPLLWANLSVAYAAPVQWTSASGGNNHYYDFVFSPNIKWTDADVAAQNLTFDGVHGYLATITSAGENAFMATEFPGEAGPFQNGWLGGFQDHTATNYSEPAGGWSWVTGEPFTYLNWVSGQPDNSGGNQDYIRSNVSFEWDDFANDPSNPSIQYVSGYFVEYVVPEPGTLGLLVLAACSLTRRRRATKERFDRVS
jgi:hypothetical protein